MATATKVPNSLESERLLDSQQAADFLGIRQQTLAVWRSTKRYPLPSVKVGRLVKYRLDDLREFVARNTNSNGA